MDRKAVYPKLKLILGISSLIILMVIFFLLQLIAFTASADSPYTIHNIAFLTTLINIVVIFIWIGLGKIAGITVSVICFSFVYVVFVNCNDPINIYFPAPFFVSVFIGYLFYKRFISVEKDYILKRQKIEEQINILTNDIEENFKDIILLKSRLSRYQDLSILIEQMSSTLSEEALSMILIDNVHRLIKKCERIMLFKVDTDKQELTLAHSKRIKEIQHIMSKKGDIFDRWVFKKKKVLLVEDTKRDFRFHHDTVDEGDIVRSVISVPVMDGEKVIGVLRCDSKKTSTFSQDDLRLLDIIGGIASVYFINAGLYRKLEELARTDGLTGLFVNKIFKELFHVKTKTSMKSSSNMSLAIIDIDNFKKYNDKYGHMAGDIVIKHIGSMLKSTIDSHDIVARYGGEEFAVLFLEKNKKEAQEIMEFFRNKVSKTPVTLRRIDTRISVSIGISALPEDSTDSEGLFRLADRRLYKAKENGKDMVCIS